MSERVTLNDVMMNIATEYYFTVGQAIERRVSDEMVSRFLSWKLPKDFHPDGGMAFIPTKRYGYDTPHWPTGTNLFNATQARDMLKQVLGAPDAPYPDRLDRMTICILVLRNGFTVTGESVCVSAENFNAAVGRKIAFDNALDKVWPLMGYELMSRLAAGEMSHSGGGDPAGVVPQR